MSKEKKEPNKPLPPQGLNPDSDLPPDADMEERFNDFWKNNGTGIFGGIAIGALIVVGIQLFQYFGEKKEASIQEAFAASSSVEEKVAFAGEYPDHQLAALAQLQVADSRYEEQAYGEAADAYAEAAKGFEDPTMASRALLGQGMSLLMGGSLESGRALLEAVALDTTALDQTRGEAAYNLAVTYWEAGDTERVTEITDIILELNSPFWIFRANSLRDRLALDAAS
ncbi:tetratricopeptide repeat protein [Puniceicoccales bacterium CK1056]|uniref:Tetratricopeptide repeat protein n=1 Tax=Oceanipulchritudo coccoides TaxID=2706888 RepID=A0A6B2M0A9_9BACT|nr:tetratricopeptide repeat protein [Oceanipulchritudo coccoides]NDV62391.1 tetratricopeptide repeat protein [Oceanipulchritudo coccoides]